MLEYIIVVAIGLLVMYSLAGVFSSGVIGKSGGAMFSGNELGQMQELFFRTLFTLLGYVAKRDGPINKTEVKRTEVFMEKMDLDAAHKREAIRLFKLGADPTFNADNTINEFKGLAKKSPNLMQILLVYLVNLARVDGALVAGEVDAIRKVAFGLGYSNITFDHLLKMVASQNTFNDFVKGQAGNARHHQSTYRTDNAGFNGTSEGQANRKSRNAAQSCEEQTRDFQNERVNLDAAYEVLGVSKNASDEDVKKAYRVMSSQFHPDKLMGQGLPSYMIQATTECFKTIQAAYDYIKKNRA